MRVVLQKTAEHDMFGGPLERRDDTVKRITEWIRHHQVLAFFILAYAITWPGLFLIYFIFPGNQIVEALAFPVVFSPALSAMLISGIAEPLPKNKRIRARWITFVTSWVLASTVQILYFWKINGLDPMLVVIIISCIFAIFPAWVLSSAYARTPGIRKHFSTILKPRGPMRWYLVVFLIFPGIPLLSMGITRLFGGQAEFYLADLGFKGAAIVLLLEFLRGFLLTGGINEESGWRGFALPRLQARCPVIVSAGIVWFFWASWHLPYDIGRGDQIAWILENRILWNLMVSIIMVWLYNRTNGSILAPALFHPAMNTFGNQFSVTIVSRVLITGLAIFAIVYDRMWERLPEESLAVKKCK
ncbi:MAG: CPBP family intramembrane metalloprotease [Spirochaetaceae bacterium]|nr:MAG: CPBP family intramembrane metalloprotease [Spirochaetaceae bacterium]